MKRQWTTGLIVITFAVSVTDCTGMSHDPYSPSSCLAGVVLFAVCFLV
ncbi:hypothetical protein [Thermoflavimicrobium dichotomicum]|uniref:Uncharacterized protein n=1 Tax=Thermoflavimicrobium dichotomicum TaxID=46223 RepID=A0A1I3V4D8_9BACL|nr:hypothetical protein [Thermoflavimicrobium dichotomicum]SFJ89783.1 hypothetical protein SAMN05421852_13313 [Thermoflavimicrobium dichotomicum]